MSRYFSSENIVNTDLDYQQCAVLLREGNHPQIVKPTPYGDVVCQLEYEEDDQIIAYVCADQLRPQVLNNLAVLLKEALNSGLRLVMLLYPSGTYHLEFKPAPELAVEV